MALVRFPEVTIKVVLDSILNLIRNDYINSAIKTESFLGKLHGGLIVGNFNFLDNAVKIFNWTKDDPKKIDTRLMYDKERANIPTIHVIIPSETPHADGIGMDEGYQEVTENEDGTSLTEYLARGYNQKYELYITAANEFEVVLILNTLKAALISNIPSLRANGFSNAKIYASDLKINESKTPIVFLRSLILEAYFEFIVPKFETINIVNNLNITGTAYDD